MKALELASSLGDLFWELFPSVYYISGSEMFCRIFVANPSDVDREYMLMARVSVNDTVISEDAIRVNGTAWFQVDAGDSVMLQGVLALEESDILLTLILYEKESGESVDQVQAQLLTPVAAADMSQLLLTMFPLLMLGSMGSMAGGIID